MKITNIIQNLDKVEITAERGDGTTFNYITATPGRYGYPDRISTYEERLQNYITRMNTQLESGRLKDEKNLRERLRIAEADLATANK